MVATPLHSAGGAIDDYGPAENSRTSKPAAGTARIRESHQTPK